LSQFILNEVGEIINILKFNPNILKLYIEEENTNTANIKDHLRSVYKITKLSRTPAYGIKKIGISNDNNVTFSLKPCQVFLFLLSKPFADRFLQNKVRNTKLQSFLKVLNYTEQFYTDNYENLIDEFYLFNNESILKEGEGSKVNSDINLIKVTPVSSFGFDLLFSRYFDIEVNDFSGIFEAYDKEVGERGYAFQYIIERRNNYELYVVYLVEKEIKEKREQLKISLDIVENINKLILNKINSTSNKFIRMLFNDKEYNNDYIDISKNLDDFEKVITIHDLTDSIRKLKELHYSTLERKELYLEDMKVRLYKLRHMINKNNYQEVKDILNHILNYKFDRNIEILKFLLHELEDVVKVEPKAIVKPVSASTSKSKRELSPQSTSKKLNLMQLNSFNVKSTHSRPKSGVAVKSQSNMYVTNINITNNIRLPFMKKKK
jgi:hypothetical protein